MELGSRFIFIGIGLILLCCRNRKPKVLGRSPSKKLILLESEEQKLREIKWTGGSRHVFCFKCGKIINRLKVAEFEETIGLDCRTPFHPACLRGITTCPHCGVEVGSFPITPSKPTKPVVETHYLG